MLGAAAVTGRLPLPAVRPRQRMARARWVLAGVSGVRPADFGHGGHALFHCPKLGVRLCFRAMWWVTSHKQGTSVLGLQQVLALVSYRTALNWH